MRTVLKIVCRSFFIYLATRGLIVEGLTGVLLLLDSQRIEDPDRPLEVRFRRGRLRPRIKIILVMEMEQSGVDPKQRYPNGLVDPLDMEQLEL